MTEKKEKQIQVTLVSTTGKYKPVSTIITVESVRYFKEHKQECINKAITKICQKRLWSAADLKRYGYTKVKTREYDKEKIQQEYERMKQEKGWK